MIWRIRLLWIHGKALSMDEASIREAVDECATKGAAALEQAEKLDPHNAATAYRRFKLRYTHADTLRGTDDAERRRLMLLSDASEALCEALEAEKSSTSEARSVATKLLRLAENRAVALSLALWQIARDIDPPATVLSTVAANVTRVDFAGIAQQLFKRQVPDGEEEGKASLEAMSLVAAIEGAERRAAQSVLQACVAAEELDFGDLNVVLVDAESAIAALNAASPRATSIALEGFVVDSAVDSTFRQLLAEKWSSVRSLDLSKVTLSSCVCLIAHVLETFLLCAVQMCFICVFSC